MGLTWLGATSVLLLIAVAVFIALLRYYRHSAQAHIHAERSAEDIVTDEVDSAEAQSLALAEGQGQAAAYAGSKTFSAPASSSSPPEFRLKWGRISIFLPGLLALLAGIILVPCALLTDLPWVWPGLAWALALLAFASLRALALKDAKARGRNYRADPRHQPAPEQGIVLTKAQKGADQEAEQGADSQKDPKDEAGWATLGQAGQKPGADEGDQLLELAESPAQRPVKTPGQQPVNYAAKSLRYARTQPRPDRSSLEGTAGAAQMQLHADLEPRFESQQKSWQPTQVPQPTYLEVEQAQRSLPDPVEIPAYEKSASSSLKEAQQMADLASGMSLDEILKRRRA